MQLQLNHSKKSKKTTRRMLGWKRAESKENYDLEKPMGVTS
jgi:hypothetical protein